MIDTTNLTFYKTTKEIVETHDFIIINYKTAYPYKDYKCTTCEIVLKSTNFGNDEFYMVKNILFSSSFSINLSCNNYLIDKILS